MNRREAIKQAIGITAVTSLIGTVAASFPHDSWQQRLWEAETYAWALQEMMRAEQVQARWANRER